MPILNDVLREELPMRIRSNHALEHGTLHVLQEKGVKLPLGGISDAGGFWIYGELDTELILEAAREALQRLAAGESSLAVHPNCGTNLAVSAVAAGGLAWLGMLGAKGSFSRRFRRLPLAVLMGLIGFELAKPLGPRMQASLTTNADVSRLVLVDVMRRSIMGYTVHRVATRLTSA